MTANGISMKMMVKLNLPDSTPVVYKEEEIGEAHTIGATMTKNWKALWGGWRNAQGTVELVWWPNDHPDYHVFYVPEHQDTRQPEKIYANALFDTWFDGSRYRHPKTLGEYKVGAALIMKVEEIHEDHRARPDQDWGKFQERLQAALKAVKVWGELENLKNLLEVGDLKLTNSTLGELFVLKGLTDMKVFAVFKQVSSDKEITISILKEFGSFHGMLKYIIETKSAYEGFSFNEWRNDPNGKKIVMNNGFRETNLQTFESWFVNR